MAVALWRRLDAARISDKKLDVLHRHRPYQASDHILAQALNMVLGDTCLEDVTRLQHDAALVRIIGGDRLPDPTRVGDFLRRFDESMNTGSLTALRGVVDELQRRAWAGLRSGAKDRLRKL